MNFFKTLFNNFNFDDEIHISGLTEELNAIFINNVPSKNILVVTSSLLEASRMYQTLSNYTDDVLLLPTEDLLSSHFIGENEEFKTKRLSVLEEIIKRKGKKIVVTNLTGYLKFLESPENFKKSILEFKISNSYNRDEIISKLLFCGYKRSDIVASTGEFSVRGHIIDVFSPEFVNPIRLEFFDEELEEIRFFDSENQLSISKEDDITIFPFKEVFSEDASGGIYDYLDEPLLIFKDQLLIEKSYHKLLEDIIDLNKTNQKKYLNKMEDFNPKRIINLTNLDDKNVFFNRKNTQLYTSSEVKKYNADFIELKKDIRNYIEIGKTVIVCVSGSMEKKKVESIFDEEKYILTSLNDIKENYINIVEQPIGKGFIYENYVVFNEYNIFKQKMQKNQYRSKYHLGSKLTELDSIKKGDYVVHSIHGIGIYNGIKTLTKQGIKKDYIEIFYKGKDKLYIPVEKIETLYKYSVSNFSTPKVSKLGSSEWTRKKLSVRKRTAEVAQKLLEMMLIRKKKKGFAFLLDSEEQLLFESEFPYKLTTDQEKAVAEIKREMEKNIPMDHLLCGDVGFGKTEVAFRAIFKAASSSKQTMFICPTTILSNQHYANALTRFANFPINIALLNRFTSRKEVTRILTEFRNGSIDLLIGTHRLFSKDLIPKDLGLLVVDEEQRFGVKHKEIIKEYKNSIDILSLSATPIPRTLQMSLVGLKTMSLLESAPHNRYPVSTYVTEYNKYLVKNAILTELSRGGQVFILYNKVRSIESKVKEIQNLVKEAKITYAHGGMGKLELEDRMYSFVNHEYDVLVCTTIIETGIDIPNVNTLIIIDADKFGLSQLYQLRGRVGRSNKVAYAYLFYKPNKVLTETAIKRLQTIKDFTHLGSGFKIASRDLAIRGAGDILGEEQAGFVDDIGIDLYMRILQEELDRKQGLEIEEEEDFTVPLLNLVSHIDDSLASEDSVKIEIHQIINSVKELSDIDKVINILQDRFGRIKEDLRIYIYECLFERKARKLKFSKIMQKKDLIEIYVPKKITDTIEVKTLFELVADFSEIIKFKYINERVVLSFRPSQLEEHYIYFLVDFIIMLEKHLIVKNK